MDDMNPSPASPGAAKGFLRNNWLALTGITAIIATIGFPLVAVVRNNEAEYQATGDFGALFGHPFDSSAHSAFKTPGYAALIAQHPDLKLSPDDAPEIRAAKIGAINNQVLARIQAEKDAATIVPRAEIAARANAQVQMKVQAQANVDLMEEAAESETTALAAMFTHLNAKNFKTESSIYAKSIDRDTAIRMKHDLALPQNWALESRTSPPGYLSIQLRQLDLANELNAASVQMPAGEFAPFVDPQGRAVWTTDAHGKRFVPGMMGDKAYFISTADYEKLGGPPVAPAYKVPQQ